MQNIKYICSVIGLSSLLLAISSTVSAGDRQQSYYQDTARVVNVEPIYNRTRYRPRECDNNAYYNDRRRTYPRRYFSEQTSTITGAVIGGVIGNQFGGGKGKTAMTIAGTVLGGSIAQDNYRNKPLGHSRNGRSHRDECRYSDDRSGYRNARNIDGYRVTYRYNGQTFTTIMDHDPGNRIPVEVSIRPAANRYNTRYNDRW